MFVHINASLVRLEDLERLAAPDIPYYNRAFLRRNCEFGAVG